MAIYQSTVQLKGKDKLITVSKSAAEQIAAVFADKSIESDHPIILGGKQYFRKGEIKNIEVLPDIDRPAAEVGYTEFYAEEKRAREKFLAFSPKAKASYTDVFEQLYKISVGEPAPGGIVEMARATQEMFFTANPGRTICDPSVLRKHIPAVAGRRMTGTQAAFFGILERAVRRDMQLENKKS